LRNWAFRKLDARIHKGAGDDGKVQVEVGDMRFPGSIDGPS
jgi:hypothetical protein